MPKPAKRLTDKQERFVAEYLIDLNAAAAARRAGYSVHTADRIGHENLRKPEIQAAVAEAIEARNERTQVSADRVVKELARIAFSDMRSYVRWAGTTMMLTDSDDLSEDDTAAVTEVTLTPGQFGDRLKIKLGHKDSALRLLAEHTGVIGAAQNINVNVNTEVQIREREERFERLYDALDSARRTRSNGSGGRSHRGKPVHPNGTRT